VLAIVRSQKKRRVKRIDYRDWQHYSAKEGSRTGQKSPLAKNNHEERTRNSSSPSRKWGHLVGVGGGGFWWGGGGGGGGGGFLVLGYMVIGLGGRGGGVLGGAVGSVEGGGGVGGLGEEWVVERAGGGGDGGGGL